MSSIVFGSKLQPEEQPLADIAALLARRMSVKLHLAHVSEDPRAPIVLGTTEESILGPVRARLNGEAERLRAASGADVRPHLAAGLVVEALTSLAEFELADMLLLGGEMRSTPSLLGAAAERASRRCAVPVLTLRDSGRLEDWLRGERPLRILIGADLGRAARAARDFAGMLAKHGPTEREVVFVASPAEVHQRLGLPPPGSTRAFAPEAEEALLRELSRAAPPDEADARLRVLPARGSADANLVSLVDPGNFDLVVVGQRRQSVFEQLWYGSVARGVLRASPVSVACVPPTAAAAAAKPAFRPPRVVLVGIDFTEHCLAAFAQAVGLVAEGGVVHVAHVIPPVPGSDALARAAREKAWYDLTKTVNVEQLGERVSSLECHVLEGLPSEQLLGLAERVGADLIVLGSRGRSLVSRAAAGSAASSVADGARVPVLLVPFPPP